ncbi:MAG: sugar ABC transporter substrate-binding protein [Clostridiales bacterium]|nr:sugar ABC transporter substrate-binding protein [Clostridiales bacterium]
MKKRMTKILSIAVVGAMALSLAACGSSSSDSTGDSSAADESSSTAETSTTSTADSDLTIGIVVKTATNAHFQDIAYGAVLAGQELGVEVRVDNTTTESDVDGQVTKCENMISAGVDALILTANDSDGVSGAVDAAHDAGIPFVTVDTEITNVWGDEIDDYMPNYIGVDHEEMAYELAKTVIDAAGGEGNVIILRGVDAASSSIERTAGFERAIAEYDNVTVLDSQSASYDQDTATTTMSDLIQAHSDIDIVLCCNDLMAVGAVTALEENGIEVGEDGVLVAGIDGNLLALQSIDEGKLYASAYDWSILQGYYAVYQAYDLINGTDSSEWEYQPNYDDDVYSLYTFTPDTIVTSENIDEYLPHGEELAEWTMGTDVESVSDYMWELIDKGNELFDAL